MVSEERGHALRCSSDCREEYCFHFVRVDDVVGGTYVYNRAESVGDIHQSCHLVGVVPNVHTLCGSAPSSSPILCLIGGHRLD